MSAKSCKGGNDLPERKIPHGHAGISDHLIQLLLRGCSLFLVRDIHSRRTDKKIPVNRRCNKNALSKRGRLREDRMADMLPGLMIQKKVIASSCRDVNFLLADHVVKLIRIDSCRVDHTFCPVLAVACPEMPDSIGIGMDLFCLRIKEEIHSVFLRILSHGNVQSEGADDSRARCIQCCHRILRKIRLHLQRLFPVKHPKSRHSVGNSLLIELLQSLQTGFIQTDNERSVPAERKIKILGERLHHLIPPQVHPRHHGSRLTVVSGVHDCTVCLGRSAAHILLFFQYADLCLIPGQLSCDCRAGYPGTDNDYVINHFSPPL